MPCVFIPPQLRELTDGQSQVEVAGRNVGQVIEALEVQFPGIRQRLVRDDALVPGLAVSIDDVVSNRGLLTRVAEDNEVHFLPSVGGG